MFKRALISMYDKSLTKDFATCCKNHNIKVIASDGTASFLEKEGFFCQRIEEITHFPEMLGGRVKTLHPFLHAGILEDPKHLSHQKDMDQYQISPIDIVVVSLYPLEKMIDHGEKHDTIIENIDIGGVALLRSAAKNYVHVLSIYDQEGCDQFINMITNKKNFTQEVRRHFASRTFTHVAHYDTVAAKWFCEQEKPHQEHASTFTITGTGGKTLRYGENPQQSCVLYTTPGKEGIPQGDLLQGSSLSYNNVLDANAAVSLVRDLSLIDGNAAACIIKHGTPCGAALGENLGKAVSFALETDKESAFGGIVALNDLVDENVAHTLSSLFLEMILAPSFSPEALVVLEKRPRVRVMRLNCLKKNHASKEHENIKQFRSIRGGFLLQSTDTDIAGKSWQERTLRCLRTGKQLSDEELKTLECVAKVCQHSRSNAIILGLGARITAIGSGQTSRVEATRCAVAKHVSFMDLYGKEFFTKTSSNLLVAASDGFFPFPDALNILIEHGVKCVIQPGGSKNDAKVLEVAQRKNITMIMDGKRHFSH